MEYNNFKNLDEEEKKTLISMFAICLNRIKSIAFKKVISIIKDIPEICKVTYKSYENTEMRKQNKNHMHPIIPTRGEIYDAYITEGIGKELCGKHPVIIIQSAVANMYSEKVTVLPIEGNGENIKSSYQEKLTSDDLEDDAKLMKDPSRIITSDLMTIDKARLGKKIGKIKIEKINKIDNKVKKQLGLQ